MVTSIADGFRSLQAVRDLRILAERAPAEARQRIAAGIWGRPSGGGEGLSALEEFMAGRDLGSRRCQDVLDAVRLTSALPNEDYPAFILATLLLLAEALETGASREDVSLYWQTFRGHYRVAAATERAAIAQAIRRIGILEGGDVTLPETAADRATARATDLKPLLSPKGKRRLAPLAPSDPMVHADLLVDAFQFEEAAADAQAIWQQDGALLSRTAPPEILAGFRHLYEIRDSWAPDGAEMIPLLDTPPGVSWPN